MINGHVPGSVWSKYRKIGSCVLREFETSWKESKEGGSPCVLALGCSPSSCLEGRTRDVYKDHRYLGEGSVGAERPCLQFEARLFVYYYI